MGVREVLAAKQVRETYFAVAVANASEAERRLEEATRDLFSARLTGPSDAKRVAALEKAVEKAREAYDACFERITFRPMPPADFERLVSEHTKDGGEVDWLSIAPPLLAACAVDSDLSEEEWRVELSDPGRWSIADVMKAARAAFDCNGRSFTVGVPKG